MPLISYYLNGKKHVVKCTSPTSSLPGEDSAFSVTRKGTKIELIKVDEYREKMIQFRKKYLEDPNYVDDELGEYMPGFSYIRPGWWDRRLWFGMVTFYSS